MTKEQLLSLLKQEGFSEKIVSAFAKVERPNFVSNNFKELAYENIALPLTSDQTISQPSTIASALSLLKVRDNQRVLEIGSGCGYVLALLAEMVGKEGKVYGVEILEELADKSRQNLIKYNNITIHNKNGRLKIEEAPFDKILISAALEEVPKIILEQLKENGILVAPIGPGFMQTLTAIQRKDNKFVIKKEIPGFIFVHFVD